MTSPLVMTTAGFEKKFSDNSGVEYAVRFNREDEEPIEIVSCDTITFPLDQLDFLIDALNFIKEVEKKNQLNLEKGEDVHTP